MAGGMGQGRDGRNLAERVHGTGDLQRRQPTTSGHPPKHVHVNTPELGLVAGLLHEWRQKDDLSWEGRCTYGLIQARHWIAVTEWVPAAMLRQV